MTTPRQLPDEDAILVEAIMVLTAVELMPWQRRMLKAMLFAHRQRDADEDVPPVPVASPQKTLL